MTLAYSQTVVSRPDQVQLCLYAGDDFYLNLTVVNEDGTPADLTGLTPKAQVRANTDTTDPVLASFTCTVSTNVVSLRLAAVDTTNLPDAACWDCQLSGAGVWTVAAGTVRTQQQVTV